MELLYSQSQLEVQAHLLTTILQTVRKIFFKNIFQTKTATITRMACVVSDILQRHIAGETKTMKNLLKYYATCTIIVSMENTSEQPSNSQTT